MRLTRRMTRRWAHSLVAAPSVHPPPLPPESPSSVSPVELPCGSCWWHPSTAGLGLNGTLSGSVLTHARTSNIPWRGAEREEPRSRVRAFAPRLVNGCWGVWRYCYTVHRAADRARSCYRSGWLTLGWGAGLRLQQGARPPVRGGHRGGPHPQVLQGVQQPVPGDVQGASDGGVHRAGK